MKQDTQEAVLDKQPEAIHYDEADKVSADLRKFNRAQAEVTKALTPLKLILKIQDAAGEQSAIDHMKKAKEVETLIENKRVFLVSPYNTEVKRINGHAKELVKDVPAEITRVKTLVLAYRTAEEEKKKKQRTKDRIDYLVLQGLAFDGKAYVLGDLCMTENEISLYDDGAPWLSVMDRVNAAIEKQKAARLQELNQNLDGASFFGEDESTAAIKEEIQKVQAAPSAPVYVPSFGGGGSYKAKGTTKTWTFEVTDPAQVPREYLVIDEKKVREAIASGRRMINGMRIFQKEGLSLR